MVREWVGIYSRGCYWGNLKAETWALSFRTPVRCTGEEKNENAHTMSGDSYSRVFFKEIFVKHYKTREILYIDGLAWHPQPLTLSRPHRFVISWLDNGNFFEECTGRGKTTPIRHEHFYNFEIVIPWTEYSLVLNRRHGELDKNQVQENF